VIGLQNIIDMNWLFFVENELLVESLFYFICILCTLISISAIFCFIIYLKFAFLKTDLDLPCNSSGSGKTSITSISKVVNYDVVDVNFQDSIDFEPYSWKTLVDDVEKNGDAESKKKIREIYDAMVECRSDLQATRSLPAGRWSLKQDSNGVKIYSTKKPGEPATFKVETIFDAPPQWVLRAVGVCDRRAEWDTEIKISDLTSFNNTLCIRRTVTEALAGGAISSRDFIDLVGLEKEGEEFRFVSRCCETSGFPEEKGRVRGRNYGSAVFLEPCKERYDEKNNSWLGNMPSCKYVGIVQVDIKGWIPQTVIDFAMTSNVDASLPPQRAWLKKQITSTLN